MLYRHTNYDTRYDTIVSRRHVQTITYCAKLSVKHSGVIFARVIVGVFIAF